MKPSATTARAGTLQTRAPAEKAPAKEAKAKATTPEARSAPSPRTGTGGYTVEWSDSAPISGISSPISMALLAGVSSRASSI
jgi:hypothetical protein